MQRRDLMKFMTGAGALNVGAMWGARELWANPTPQEMNNRRGLPALKITNVKAILFAATRIRLVVVKVETSEPGLYGIGCATFTQRAKAVVTAVDEFLKPFLMGKDPDHIEDIWQAMYVSSYWRNGPVLYNAMSGVDQALWDIKGKQAGMPVYELLGGKCRDRVPLYKHCSGNEIAEVAEQIQAACAQGYTHCRAQVAVPHYSTYGAKGMDA